MKGIILLADHFEDVEALITIDILRRANITIDLVSVVEKLELNTQSNITIKAEKLYEDISLNDYDFLIIPGGKAVFETHLDSHKTKEAVDYFYSKNKLIASICAAPGVLGKYGYLDNTPYVCFPSCEEFMPKGILMKEKRVVVSNNIITSKAAGTTFDFAYEIVKYLTSEEKANNVINSVYYK